MPKLPVISGKELVKKLEKIGFCLVSQKGSHIKLRRENLTIIIPQHPEIRKGTLYGILKNTNLDLTK
jgi:predicted RNA binding protein YcfA (HicA-like mRNA interferase family)